MMASQNSGGRSNRALVLLHLPNFLLVTAELQLQQDEFLSPGLSRDQFFL